MRNMVSLLYIQSHQLTAFSSKYLASNLHVIPAALAERNGLNGPLLPCEQTQLLQVVHFECS